MKLSTAIKLIQDELDAATAKFGTFNSCHEGYAILLEEVEELWAEIKADNGTTHRGTSEAVQVAAMALRYLIDMCPEQSAVEHVKKVDAFTSSYSRSGYSG